MQDIKKQAVVVGRRCSLKIRIPGSSQSCRIGLSRGSREFALKNGRLRTQQGGWARGLEEPCLAASEMVSLKKEKNGFLEESGRARSQ